MMRTWLTILLAVFAGLLQAQVPGLAAAEACGNDFMVVEPFVRGGFEVKVELESDQNISLPTEGSTFTGRMGSASNE
jgi:hypothetical protein